MSYPKPGTKKILHSIHLLCIVNDQMATILHTNCKHTFNDTAEDTEEQLLVSGCSLTLLHSKLFRKEHIEMHKN